MELREHWAPIKGFETSYLISNLGRVMSCERFFISRIGHLYHVKEKILKPVKDAHGYLQVMLSTKDHKHVHRYIHRLVGEAFLPNPKNYPEINHIDENKANNIVTNLEWCTRLYNENYGSCSTNSANTRRNTVKLSRPVCQLTSSGKFIKCWPSVKEAGRNGYCEPDIIGCCHHVRKSHKGFIWIYAKEYRQSEKVR